MARPAELERARVCTSLSTDLEYNEQPSPEMSQSMSISDSLLMSLFSSAVKVGGERDTGNEATISF